MSAHTPGPWMYRLDTGTGYGRIESTRRDLPNNDPVVLAVREDWNRYLSETPEGQANARLIAAAPEMLEALRAMLGLGNITSFQPGRAEALARAAIAKAEGRTL
jgi:hypothetical protein